MKTLAAVITLALVLPFYLPAVSVKKIETRRYEDFQKGDLKGVSIDSLGHLSLGPEIAQIAGPDAEYYLALDIGSDGDIYVGTGHQAAVYRIHRGDGTIKKVFESDHLDVHALLARRSGDLYVGTSPGGKVYKVRPDGKTEVVFDPDEKFIWDLKPDGNGHVICAVGNSGGIYSLAPSGDSHQIFTGEDAHIVSLHVTRNNAILAGSGDRGVLYKIENRKVRVLYDSPLEEVRGICEDGEGNVFFSATKGGFKFTVPDTGQIQPLFAKNSRKPAKPVPETSILYRLHPNGTVETVWSSREDYVYSVAYDEKNNGVVMVTGNTGRVYRVYKDGRFALIYEGPSAQVFKLAAGTEGFTLIGNNTAAILDLKHGLANQGTYLSEVYDAEVQSRFGRIYWDARSPAGSVSLTVRGGNANIADATWTEWSPPFGGGGSSPIGLSGYRYVQVKVVLNASNVGGAPRLSGYRLYYRQSNLKPRVHKISVEKPEVKPAKSVEEKKAPRPDNHLLTIKWEARDPNDDSLKYTLYIKKTEGQQWILLKKNIPAKIWKLDTELFEDGDYLARVVVDDALDNPPAEALSSEIVSEPFVVDSTAPEIKSLQVSNRRVSFEVVDRTSIVSEVMVSFDRELWIPVVPLDSIGDSSSERFDFEIQPRAEEKLLFIKVVDEYQNSKVFQREL